MTALITGGTGFVGLGLAEHLAAEGGDVVIFGVKPPPEALARRLPADRIRILTGDVRSEADLARALSERAVDLVFHLAAVTAGPQMEREHPRRVLSVNIEGTAAVLEAVAQQRPPPRVVAASSGSVYGLAEAGAGGRLSESGTWPRPASLYAISKLAGEQVALRLGELHGLDVCVVRLGPVYGPWEYPTGVREVMSPLRQIVDCAAGGRPVVLPRAMPADWLYVRDAARGLAAAARSPELGGLVVNLGGGAVFDLTDWCRLISERRPALSWRLAQPGEPATIVCNPAHDRPPLDNGRIIRATGFRPVFNPRAAADDYLAWIDASADSRAR